MRRATPRIAHVMKTVERSNKIEALFSNSLCGGSLETDAVRDAVLFRMSIGLLNGRLVKVVSDE
jgi:hypothetical protein